MRREGDRVIGVYGPTPRGKYRILWVEDGDRNTRTLETKEEAEATAEAMRQRLTAAEETTVEQAIDRFCAWLEKRGRTKRTADTTRRTLAFFFGGAADRPIAELTAARAARLYQIVQTTDTRFGRPPSANTHRQALMMAKALLKWAVREKLHRGPSPLAEVEPEGQLHRGKPQLRIDEARRWLARAQGLALDEAGAAMALTCLLLGLRPGECAGLTVRDLDDGGTLLWVKGKAKPNKPPEFRPVEVPASLVPVLEKWARDKLPAAPLFGVTAQKISKWTRKICTLAEVEIPREGWRQLCGHSLRGLHATIAVQAGATSHVVAGALGNTAAVLDAHYVQPGTREQAEQRRAAMRLV